MVGFAVISRRTSRRWTLVRDGSSNAESAVNPAVGRRPEASWYHPNTSSSLKSLGMTRGEILPPGIPYAGIQDLFTRLSATAHWCNLTG
jgi:hypothetical protein